MSQSTKKTLSFYFIFSLFNLGIIGCQTSGDQESELTSLSRSATLSDHTQVRLSEHERAVIYGEDSRLEYYQLAADDVMKRRVMYSTGLLVRPSDITVQGQRVLLNSYTLGEAQGLCPDELFANQPEPGFCSGVLIDDDLFLTAGHCMDDVGDCANTRVVFRSLYTAQNDLYPTTTQDLYH